MKRLQLDLTSVIVAIAAGVLLPVLLSTAAGIVAIVFAENAGGIVTGVLVISFAVTAAGCGLVAMVLASRKARLARLQADFVAGVSHELRTPLSAIRLYAQTLQTGKLTDDPEKEAECVGAIIRETEWLDVMVDTVLAWRGSSKDKLPLNMEVSSVSDAVEGALARFRSMVLPDEVELELVNESNGQVRHDAIALNSVLLNLLTNAYKYTGASKKISVTVRDDEECVMIRVTDNGNGLTAAEAEHIFEPFYRPARENNSAARGVGLGLPIARYLVERHDGTITVESTQSEGSCFTIALPICGDKS